MAALLIQNGYVVDPSEDLEGNFDILIEGGKIAQVDSKIKASSSIKKINAQDLVVAPGLIDVHVHLREPGQEYKETIETGTKAAAAGGFTSVCCMANTSPVNDEPYVTQAILTSVSKHALVNVYPIGAVSKNLEGKEFSEMGLLKQAGCIAFSDDGKTIENAAFLRKALEYLKGLNLPLISHALCNDLTGKGVMNEGEVSAKLGLRGIPHAAEEVIIARDIAIAQLVGHPIHFAHVSTARGVELIADAKKRKVPVTAEVSPHHLTLTDEACIHYDPNTKMAPPLRTQKDIEALKKGLKNGTIDVIASDHAPHAISEKELGFDAAPCGIIGLETALSLCLRLVKEGVLTLKKLIEVMSFNPAKLFKLPGGTLRVGSPADIVLFDPNQTWVYETKNGFSKSVNSPFDHWHLEGKVCQTLVAGKVVYSA